MASFAIAHLELLTHWQVKTLRVLTYEEHHAMACILRKMVL